MLARRDPHPRITVAAIEAAVAERYHVTRDDLRSRSQAHDVVLARHVAIYLVRLTTGASFAQIGMRFDRDRSTAFHAHRQIAALAARNPRLRETLAQICNNLP